MDFDEGMKTCSNCERTFAENKIDLHEAYCCRNFRKCEFCGVMIDRNYLSDHQNEFHQEKECQFCKQKYLPSNEQAHILICFQRPQHCLYCENNYPASIIDNHRQTCGSRTKKCVICSKYIMLREIDAHLVRCTNRRERRQNSQNQRQPPRDGQNQLYRQNSSNNVQLNKPKQKSTKQLLVPKPAKIKPTNIIGPDVVGKKVDPIPLGVKLAIQKRDMQKRNKLKQKKHHEKQSSSQKKNEVKNEYY